MTVKWDAENENGTTIYRLRPEFCHQEVEVTIRPVFTHWTFVLRNRRNCPMSNDEISREAGEYEPGTLYGGRPDTWKNLQTAKAKAQGAAGDRLYLSRCGITFKNGKCENGNGR